ncbi:tetratricopeptide repeat protein [Nitrosococcus wardiae]|uniref:Uncharacterized protein n=1 Tax=Nitrosococcus wardiae TaxID=1814290 RepID=A0A4P7BVJ5_9GAMM|nr:hypothetical protein [Nitrosococcus wardiae]QBQ53921.1 hypothetical protein E3U44_04885 [Nitrosococcus wardiae]
MSRKISPLSMLVLLVAVLWLGVTFSLAAKEKEKPDPAETDFLALAAMLLKDGHSLRALTTLNQVDPEAEELDRGRFYTLKGLAQLNLQQEIEAKESFQQALAHGQTEPIIHVYLAQAHYALKEYRETVAAIEQAGTVIHQYPALYEMKAQSYWLLGEQNAAWRTLSVAHKAFPEDYRFLRRQVFYLLDLKLYRQAAELGRRYFVQSQAEVADYMAIGNALRLSRQSQEALTILEQGRLLYPHHEGLAKVLAHTYLDLEQPFSAAYLLEQAARNNPELLAEAAELYRRAGRFYRALGLNAEIRNQKVKFKQRLSILLALKRYAQASGMETDLYRVGLLSDENIRYAIAYANFAIGDYEQADQHLKHIRTPDLFKKSVALRRAMDECRAEPERCL